VGNPYLEVPQESDLPHHGVVATLASRASFVAARAFGITAVIVFPLVLLAALAQMSQARSPADFGLGALVIFPAFAFGIPLLAAFLAVQGARTLPVPAASLWPAAMRNLLVWLLALLAGPMTLVVWMMIGDAKNAKESAASVQHGKRPIVDTGAPGFTAAPVYGVADGVPTALLTARIPSADNYGFTFEATDRAGHKLLAFEDTTLAPGVATVPLRVKFSDFQPVVPRTIAWPVVVTQVSVATFHPSGTPAAEQLDIRLADTLAVMQGPVSTQ
jgi:hypothetical protein